jgi:Ca-activated chloride channel family protein
MADEPDFYEILNVRRDASLEEVRHAYRNLARQYHPDAQASLTGTAVLFRQIQEAYEVLSDARRREAYNRQIADSGSSIDSLFALELQVSRDSMPVMAEEQILYVLFDIKAAQSISKTQRLPLNLCLVIDRSTSMQGPRLEQVKVAAHHLIDSLSESDSLSIVAFSDRAEVVWPNQSVGDSIRAKARVSAIQALGGTEILQGLRTGLDELEIHRRSQSVNHLILLTDGQTYGDEAKCLELAGEAKRRNVGISGLGIGEDWNDGLLDGISTRSGGTSHYIASAADVQAIMKERLQGLTALYGDELQLILHLSEGMRVRNAFRLTPYIQRIEISDDGLQLGTLQADATINGLLELIVGEQPPGKHRLAQVELIGNVPALDRKGNKVRAGLSVAFTADAPAQPMVPPNLLNALAKVTIFQMQESAWQSIEKGDVAAATQRLEIMATRLLDLGEHQLARAALLEAGRLARSGHLSPAGEKAIKYGTRSLSLITVKDK